MERIILVDGDNLGLSIPEQENATLIALSETRFAILEFEATVFFIVKDGKVTSLLLDQETGPDLTFTRLDSPT